MLVFWLHVHYFFWASLLNCLVCQMGSSFPFAYFIGLLLETNESEDVKVLSDVSSITNGTTCLVNAVVIPGRHPDIISLPLKYGTNSWHDDQNHEALPKGGFPACGPVRNPFLPASLNGLLIRSLLFVLRRGRWKIRTCFPLNLSY